MRNKHRNKDKNTKGMNTQSHHKHSNMQSSANGPAEILCQSRNILYGQDGINVPIIGSGEHMNGNVYQNMPNGMPSSTQMTSVQMNPT